LIRILIVGYVFGIRSEWALCREVGVNLAYRWFCGRSTTKLQATAILRDEHSFAGALERAIQWSAEGKVTLELTAYPVADGAQAPQAE
jgi:transposase